MRGDAAQSAEAEAGGDSTPTRTGPRHAAPRKSLLSKFQVPAGKAMALAAMPTAVLVGMGLTPRLALADEQDIPFAPGPCVTRSDEPSASESPTPTPTPTPSESDSAGQGGGTGEDRSPSPDASASASPSASESASDSAGDPASGPAEDATSGQAGKAKPPTATPSETRTPTPASTPTSTKTSDPLDPLGVGDAIKDILDGPDKEPKAIPSATEPATGTATGTAASEPSAKPSETPSTEPSSEPPSGKPSGESSTKPVDEAADRAKQAIKDAADKAGAEVEELPDDAKGLDPKKDEDIPDGAKPRFPCPTADPQALADAKLEPGIPLLPDDPWKLESTRLTLLGLDYHGIVEVKTAGGKVKKVLKFTSTSVDIKDLHQLTVHSEGRTGHVKSRPGSTSTIRDGTVTMYTEELKGNLFGIVPITFSPETPPPLNVPFAFFTDVKVTQAGQFGGTLTVPGLKNYVEG